MSIANKLQIVADNLATENEKIIEQASLLVQISEALDGKTGTMGGGGGDYYEGYADGKADAEETVLAMVNGELEPRGLEGADNVDEIPTRLDDGFESVSEAAYKNGYDKGYEDGTEQGGGDNYYDTFWDVYQENGNRTDYSMLFGGAGWTTETFKPKYLIKPGGTGNHYMMFARTGVEVLDERVLDASQATAFSMSFYNSSKLRSITIDLSSLTALADTFNYDGNLETVVLKNVPETCNFTGGFSGCNKLTNFTVTGVIGGTALNLSWSPLLTDASVQNIIDHLKDRTGTTSATLTFHNTVGGNMTQAQKDAISAKNWTLAY